MPIHNFFFKYRSFTPIPLVLSILYYSNISYPECMFGGIIIAIGEFIRLNAVQYAGGETRTIKVGAPALCTAGPYARTRNPLYIGNMIIYSGVIIAAAGPHMWLLLLISFLFFSIQYTLIVQLEESTLYELFGQPYIDYQNNVPRLFPRFSSWKNNDNRIPSSIIKTLKTERRTLQNLAVIILILLLKSQYL
ncbi:MAG: isoprenylcysteine carboxylmethyltransferase family protein [Candidatus Marinimicrobia bacterium]|nr:isoprenylcysteine carboxylmethyltransferase family protein [Candidatus Neomarinimicrobiota bacterium]